MLKELPRRYRWSVAGLVLGSCMVLGLWVGANPSIPILTQAGLALGCIAGLPLAWFTTHAPRTDAHSPAGRTVQRHP